MLKVWNVFLICLTFFMTIFGTFLTRSGVIASVHSFAQSSIGDYFLYFLVLVGAFCFTLVMYRWPELRDLKPTERLRTAAIVDRLGHAPRAHRSRGSSRRSSPARRSTRSAARAPRRSPPRRRSTR